MEVRITRLLLLNGWDCETTHMTVRQGQSARMSLVVFNGSPAPDANGNLEHGRLVE